MQFKYTLNGLQKQDYFMAHKHKEPQSKEWIPHQQYYITWRVTPSFITHISLSLYFQQSYLSVLHATNAPCLIFFSNSSPLKHTHNVSFPPVLDTSVLALPPPRKQITVAGWLLFFFPNHSHLKKHGRSNQNTSPSFFLSASCRSISDCNSRKAAR